MGCASAVNRKDEDLDSKRIIRLDLQTIKTTSTPKNEINLMKLTEQLLKVLEALCGEDIQKFQKFQDQIINNTVKLDKKQDEVTYLISTAKEQILVFQENGNIINLCYDLIAHLAKMLELNQKTFLEREEWYYKYSYVLIYEIAEFKGVLSYIIESSTLKQQYSKKNEIIFLYACLLGSIRFLEGISWGYSVFLMHQQLDQDNIYAAKVMFNLMLRLKQSFKENKDFQSNISVLNDKPACYHSDYYFRNALSYSSIEKLVTDTDHKKEDKLKNQQNQFLQNQVFRKTYVAVKKLIDDWLRKVTQHEITVNEMRKYRQVKGFTRNFLRDLKNPRAQQQIPDTPQQQLQSMEEVSLLPTFEIENSQNIMIVTSNNDADLKVVIESFLQANVKSRTKYKCCVLHHCVRENKLTQDPYYIVKNIIFQIIRSLPCIKNYMRLQEHNFVKEMMQGFEQDKLELQKDYPEVLVKFFKVLKELKLDFNLGIFITGVETLFDQNRMDNFLYLLRSSSVYFPNFIKMILTIEKRSDNVDHVAKILRIIQTQNIVEINDQEVFQNEGKSYLEFALLFGAGASQVQPKQPDGSAETQNQQNKKINASVNLLDLEDSNEESKENGQIVTVKDNLELCLQRCQNSYRKGIELIHGIYKKGINPKDQRQIKDFLTNFLFEEEVFKNSITKALAVKRQDAIDVMTALSQLQGPIHIDTFSAILTLQQEDENYKDNVKKVIKELTQTLSIQNSQIQKINPMASSDDYIDNPKTMIVLKKKSLLLSILTEEFKIEPEKAFFSDRIYSYHISVFEGGDVENEFEDLDSYMRIYVFKHLGRSQVCNKVFNKLENLFCVKNIYKQILYHKSYLRFRLKLQDLYDSPYIDKDEKAQLLQFSNILYLIEQTIKNEPLNFLDFCTQLRGRILGESLSDFLSDLRLDITSENICYFKNFHHALRENPRIDVILKFPKCTVLKIKFFQDKKRVLMSMSNGLMIVYNTIDYCVQKVFANKMAIIDSIKIMDDKYLVTAGIDPKIRIWNIESEKLVHKYEVHQYSTIFLVQNKDFTYSYGYDMRLAKYNFRLKQLDSFLDMDSQMTALKLIKSLEDQDKLKLAAGFITGSVILYDLQLNKLKQIQMKTVNEEVIQLINLSNTEFLCFTKEGSISIMNNCTLEESKSGSIFNLKSEDYIDLILIKSREFFLFTLEKQKIEFYSANTFKRTDSWDYFFERDLICCDKNKEGSKIFVSDKGGYTILFNFLKHLDQTKENLVPCNRRYDPVVCIEVTEKVEQNSIISCSQDRDLRIWKRENGVFIKKYDLSSFTGENITAMKLGKDENMLFLGSKDMNVYLIDIAKGKLCVVYEGHWNRVTSIYTIPNKDILITISESNIKVWDLEYDECIKNMNEHNSSICYITQSSQDEEQVMTIGQSFEFKIWNYVTGAISQSHEIELNKDKKQLKNLNVSCCDVQQDLAYIALNTNEVCVYSIKENKVLYSFVSYNDEQIIFLNGIKTEQANYLIIVTRTACILYLVQKDGVKRLCSYLVNARKKPKKKKHDNKYSYNVRYYFTSAKITQLNAQVGTQTNYAPTKRHIKNNNPGSSVLLESSNINDNLMQKDNFVYVIKVPGQEKPGEGNSPDLKVTPEKGNNTKIVDTIGARIKDTVVLVCLGDSRGFVHMNHLILK